MLLGWTIYTMLVLPPCWNRTDVICINMHLFDFLVKWSTWSFQFNSWIIYNPRSLHFWITGNFQLLKVTWGHNIDLFDGLIIMTSHLREFGDILTRVHSVARLLKVFCIEDITACLTSTISTGVISFTYFKWKLTFLQMFLITAKNIMGPRCVPWGTPKDIFSHRDSVSW